MSSDLFQHTVPQGFLGLKKSCENKENKTSNATSKEFEHIVQTRNEMWNRTGILENCISTQVEMMYDIRIHIITKINIVMSI